MREQGCYGLRRKKEVRRCCKALSTCTRGSSRCSSERHFRTWPTKLTYATYLAQWTVPLRALRRSLLHSREHLYLPCVTFSQSRLSWHRFKLCFRRPPTLLSHTLKLPRTTLARHGVSQSRNLVAEFAQSSRPRMAVTVLQTSSKPSRTVVATAK